MSRLGKIARRTFLFGTAAVAGGVAFGYYRYRKPYENPLLKELGQGETSFNAYVKIASDGKITVIVPRAEMGQGVTTTLAALVAEELDVRLDQLTIEHGPAAPAYYNSSGLEEGAPFPKFEQGVMVDTVKTAMAVLAKFLALQFTGGSSSTVDAFEGMRHAGALAREMLKQAASQRLDAPAARLQTAEARVTDPASGRSLSYGDLALAAAALEPPTAIKLRRPSEWKLLAKPQKRTDSVAKVTGAPVFGIDVELSDMLHATIRMNPNIGGRMKSFDASGAQGLRGIRKIVPLETPYGNGFAVIADNTWRAFQAADLVTAEWEKADYPQQQADIEALLDRALAGDEKFSLRTLGDPDSAFENVPADRIVSAEYSAPYLSHAPMEPMNATAQVKDGYLDVWLGNQSPSIVQLVGSRITGFDNDHIRVHTTMMGGGFGRRFEPDFMDYAIRLAMLTDGRPVKVTWTREEDMTHGSFRPAVKSRYRAVLKEDGMPLAVTGSVAAQSIISSVGARIAPSLPLGAGNDKSIVDGAFNQPYAFENHRIDGYKLDLAIPVGSWRSVGNSFNAFMQESFLDEIAHKGGIDPLKLRQNLLKGSPVALAVLNRAAEMSDWSTPIPKGKARGIGFCLAFGTFVAQVVQVADRDGKVKIEKVWCAADPGLALDPEIFKAQMMSGIIYGLSSAVNQKITFAGGAIEQSNFYDFEPLRMENAPDVEVEILQNSTWMGGAGEPGTPPSIPALANAVFALTGKRIRRLPMADEIEFA
jgi:isoquinoline 1-oxidoreductase beta subunit